MKWSTGWRRKNRITMWSGWWCRKSAGKSVYAEKSFHMEDPVSIYGGATSRCSNCSSYKAHYTGKRILKKERLGELLCMVESVPLVVSGAGRTIDSLVLERLDYRLATEEEREKIPDKSTEKHLALAYYDTLTGMFTRQGFFIHARGCWRRSKPGMKILY